jgi:multiple sugar transport system ATP-binding protein
MLGIEGLLQRKPKQLSGGQRQRVAVGRAIVREPQVFLMDEPLSNLDAALRVQTRTEIKKLHARLQTTTIYVTHDQVEAMTMGDRIVVMRDGLVQQVDTPLNLYERPANMFVAGFIGSPAMNFVVGQMVRSDGAFAFDAGNWRVPIPADISEHVRSWDGKRVVFGIRPEHMEDAVFAAPHDHRATLRAKVEVHEPLGADVILYLDAGGHSIVARVDAHSAAKMGDDITVALDLRKMHLFNAETHEVIV